MKPRAHLIHSAKIRDAAQMCYATAVHDGSTKVIDQLILDEMFAVPNRVEYLTDSERRNRVLSNPFEAALIVSRRRVFQPEQSVRLKVASKARCLDWRHAVMRIVHQLNPRTMIDTQFLEQLRNDVQVLRRRPYRFQRQFTLGRFVRSL